MPRTVLDARDAEVSEARQVPAPEAFLFRRWVCVCVCVGGWGGWDEGGGKSFVPESQTCSQKM